MVSQYNIIKHMLSKPMLHSRIGKWSLVLTEFSLRYVPMKAIKGQVLADFVVDHKIKDVEIWSELETQFVGQKAWVMYFDGSKHKDGAGIGILVTHLLVF